MLSDKSSTINNNSSEEISKNNEDNNENFYDICIQAIESNNDKILDKEECYIHLTYTIHHNPNQFRQHHSYKAVRCSQTHTWQEQDRFVLDY